LGFARVCNKRWLPFQDVDELVLGGMGVTECGNGAWRHPGEIDAKVCEPEEITKRPFLPTPHHRCKGFGINRGFCPRMCVGGDYRQWLINLVQFPSLTPYAHNSRKRGQCNGNLAKRQ